MDLMGTKLEESVEMDKRGPSDMITFWGFFTLVVQQLVGRGIMTGQGRR